jgi:hypothetical protein
MRSVQPFCIHLALCSVTTRAAPGCIDARLYADIDRRKTLLLVEDIAVGRTIRQQCQSSASGAPFQTLTTARSARNERVCGPEPPAHAKGDRPAAESKGSLASLFPSGDAVLWMLRDQYTLRRTATARRGTTKTRSKTGRRTTSPPSAPTGRSTATGSFGSVNFRI